MLSLDHRRHPSSSPCLPGERVQLSQQKQWLRVISAHSSRRNAGWVWAQTEVSSCARCVLRNRRTLSPLTNCIPSTSWTETVLVRCTDVSVISVGINLYFPGRFAVKKIAVGESHTYLVDILREVRLLEALRHPNIITYHHSWLEPTQFSLFGPKVPALLYVSPLKPSITLNLSQYAYAMGRGWEVRPLFCLVNPDL